MSKKCSVCFGDIDEHKRPDGTVYWSEGHNAEPLVPEDDYIYENAENIAIGRCCDSCNGLVLAVRMGPYMGDAEGAQKVIDSFYLAENEADLTVAYVNAVLWARGDAQ